MFKGWVEKAKKGLICGKRSIVAGLLAIILVAYFGQTALAAGGTGVCSNNNYNGNASTGYILIQTGSTSFTSTFTDGITTSINISGSHTVNSGWYGDHYYYTIPDVCKTTGGARGASTVCESTSIVNVLTSVNFTINGVSKTIAVGGSGTPRVQVDYNASAFAGTNGVEGAYCSPLFELYCTNNDCLNGPDFSNQCSVVYNNSNDTGTVGNCSCNYGYTGAPYCQPMACQDMYANTTGTFPSCSCVFGYSGTPGSCHPQQCSSLYGSTSTGTYPNCSCVFGYSGNGKTCQPVQCSTLYANTVGTYPNCACNSAYIGTPGNCVIKTCQNMYSSAYTGTYPTCVAPACPSGYTGTYPNCVAPSCSTFGETGTYPNCQGSPQPSAPTPPASVAPPTTTPNNASTCPTGYTGTPPNCTVAPTDTCPAGYTGTPPNCTTASTLTSKATTDSAFIIQETNVPYGACIQLAGYLVNQNQLGVSVNGSAYSSAPMTVGKAQTVCTKTAQNVIRWKVQ